MVLKYAADTNFVGYTNGIKNLDVVLQSYNLKMNPDKTEFINVNRENVNHISTKVLGSLVSDNLNISHRIVKANAAFHSMWKIWIRKKYIGFNTRLRIYNVCILPIHV